MGLSDVSGILEPAGASDLVLFLRMSFDMIVLCRDLGYDTAEAAVDQGYVAEDNIQCFH